MNSMELLEKEQTSNIYSIKVDEYFDLDKILYGQCFRWKKDVDGNFIGVIDNNVIKIWQKKNYIYFYGLDNNDLDKKIYDYFDLQTNYKEIIETVQNKKKNRLLDEIITYSKGTRILNQSIFEILISYIFSTSNNIPRIEGSIEKLSMLYGNKLVFEGKEYYTFPTLNQLKNVAKQDYREKIKIGYRDEYVYDTVQRLVSNEFDLYVISKLDSNIARNELIKLNGVGPKVANCVLLFSMRKKDVFPIDTWIQKVMEVYSNNNKISKKEIENIVQKDFGKYSGIFNHYMFYWGRENKI